MLNFKDFYTKYILNENVLNEVPRNIMGMETTYENFPVEEPYGFWVDRSGNWIAVPYQGHSDVGEKMLNLSNEYLKAHGKPEIDLWRNTIYNILFQAGFMRVVTAYASNYELHDPSDKPTTSQQKFLNMCKVMWSGDDLDNLKI